MNWKQNTRIEVEVRNGDINRALQIFKRKVISLAHLDEIKEKKEYKKPSVVKRQMMQEAAKEQYKFTKKENSFRDYIKSKKKK
jgi:ribosomal protein S21